jgi:hypothetical protein
MSGEVWFVDADAERGWEKWWNRNLADCHDWREACIALRAALGKP